MPLACQIGNSFQDLAVADAMIPVHAEAQTNQVPSGDIDLMDGGDARHVLTRRAKASFVAAHETVRPAVHQDDCIDLQFFDQSSVRVSQWLDSGRTGDQSR